jgi:hypothetical protein
MKTDEDTFPQSNSKRWRSKLLRSACLAPTTKTDMQKPLTPNEFWTQAERQLCPQAPARAARRKEYGISLRAPFDDKHPALPHMTPEQRERYLSAAAALSEAKKKRKALLTDPSHTRREDDPELYVELSEHIIDVKDVIEQIVDAVIDRLPEKRG